MSASESCKKTNGTSPPWFADRSAIGWWTKTIAFLGALLLATGAFLALFHPGMLVSPHDEINGAAHIYAGYLASRNLALAILILVALALRARPMLSSLLLLASLIQFLDAIIDAIEARWPIVPGVLILGLLFFAATTISSSSFWKLQAR